MLMNSLVGFYSTAKTYELLGLYLIADIFRTKSASYNQENL